MIQLDSNMALSVLIKYFEKIIMIIREPFFQSNLYIFNVFEFNKVFVEGVFNNFDSC